MSQLILQILLADGIGGVKDDSRDTEKGGDNTPR